MGRITGMCNDHEEAVKTDQLMGPFLVVDVRPEGSNPWIIRSVLTDGVQGVFP